MLRRSPATTRAALWTSAAIVVALVVSACSAPDHPSAASATRPTTTTAAPTTTTTGPATPAAANGFPAGWTPTPLDWTSCDLAADAECATLTVPLDWARPTGPTIDLALGRLAATGDHIGSLLVNPGGPGASGLDLLAGDPFSPSVAKRFDIVSWDPRGVGESTAVTCGRRTVPPFLASDPDPDTPDEQSTLDSRAVAVAQDSAAHDAALLPHLGTADVARDLEAIRLALGDGPLNYVGFSYGTQIGQQYAEFFPDHIRTMVLDGVVDPAQGFTDFLFGQIRGFDQSFEANSSACRAAGRDECGVVDLAQAYDRVRAQVEVAPLPAGKGHHVGPAELAVAATYVAYGSDGWKDLGPALARAISDHDGSDLWELAQSYYDFGGYGVYAGVVCLDTPPPSDPAAWKAFADRARALSPRFGGSVANELLPCASWPVRSPNVPAALTAPGAPPILVIGNTGDPATPYENAVAVSQHLSSAVLVTADIEGHTAYGADRCVTRITDRYLIDLTVPPAGTSCG